MALGLIPPRRASSAIDGLVHEFLVACRETRIGEAEDPGEPAEYLGVRQRLALRPDDRLGALQPVMAVGGIEVVAFEMRRRRQHDVAVRHALGHRHVDADGEDVVTLQPLAHAVLVGMHDDRVVVVDERAPGAADRDRRAPDAGRCR